MQWADARVYEVLAGQEAGGANIKVITYDFTKQEYVAY